MKSHSPRAYPVSVVMGRKEYVGAYEIIRGKVRSIRVFFGGRQTETRLGPKVAVTLARQLMRELLA